MIRALLLVLALSSAAFGQSTAPASGFDAEDIVYQNLKKSVRELQSGRPTITAVPSYINGITFPNGTQLSAVGGANVSTFNAAAQFNGSTEFNDAAVFNDSITANNYTLFIASVEYRNQLIFGSQTAGTTWRHPITYWAKSVDGATQSSGCVVAVTMSSAGNGSPETSFFQFTSTTSAAQYAAGILVDNTCTPGAYCRVAMGGLVRARAASGMTIGNCAITGATRCLSASGTAISASDACSGTALSTTNADGQWFWLLMGNK